MGTGWGRGLDEGLTPCARPIPSPPRGRQRLAERYSQTKSRAWRQHLPGHISSLPGGQTYVGASVGAPTARQPFLRAGVRPPSCSESENATRPPGQQTAPTVLQTYFSLTTCTPWLLPHLCPALLQSLLCTRRARSDPHGRFSQHRRWDNHTKQGQVGPEPSGNFPHPGVNCPF